MALLGTLQVRLGLDSGVFTKGLGRAAADAKKQAGGIATAFNGLSGLGKVFTGLATAAAAVSFGKMIQGANDLTDSMRDSSIRLGIGIGDLQAFELAAGNAGIESGKLTDLLGKLNKSAGEIKLGQGTDKLAGAFKAIGISVADVQRSNPAQLFEKVITGLGGIEDPAARAALSMQIFGKSGQAALTLVADGVGAIENSKKILDDFGLSLTKINGDNVDAANDALGTLGFLATAAKQKLGAELAPVITDLANRFLTAGNSGQTLGQKIAGAATAIGQFVNAGLAIGNVFSAAFNLLTAGFAGAGAAVLGFASDFVTAIGTTAPNALNGLLEATETGLTKMKQGFADFATAAANVVVAGMNQAITAVDTLVNAAAAGITKFLELANKVPGVNLGSFSYSQTSQKASGFDRFPVDRVDLGRVPTFGAGAADSLGSYSEGFGMTADSNLKDAGTDIRQAAQAAQALFNPAESNQLAAGLKEASDYAKELTGDLGGGSGGGTGGGSGGKGGATGAMEGLADKAKEVGDAMKLTGLEVGNVWKDAMQSIGSAIDEFVKTGKLDFKSLADSILQSIASAAIKNAINSLFSTVGSAFGATTGGTSGTGWVGSILKAFGSFEGGGYTGSGSRTGGMDGRGGRLAMLHPQETVIDHAKVRGGSRSNRRPAIALSVPITLMPGVSRDELARIMPLLKKDIIQTIPALIARGGRFASAFGQ